MNSTTPPSTPTATNVASPCTNVCRISDDTGLCEGCLRSLQEIAAWSAMSDQQRLQVLAAIDARRVGGRCA